MMDFPKNAANGRHEQSYYLSKKLESKEDFRKKTKKYSVFLKEKEHGVSNAEPLKKKFWRSSISSGDL
jgi:hypothetical protein